MVADGFQDAMVPGVSLALHVLGALHEAQFCSLPGRLFHPGIHVGWKFLPRNDDVFPPVFPRCEGQVLGGDGHAVADRGHQGHPFRRRVDQLPEQLPEFIGSAEKIRGGDMPGNALAPQAGDARGLHRFQQGAHVGAVEIMLVLRQGEQAALAGQHGSSLFGGVEGV